MKAIVRTRYGGTEQLKLQEIAKPVPKSGEVLVKVHAVSLNASDVENMKGSPLYIRMWGLMKPRFRILGSDIAGVVEAAGGGVTRFKRGDEVYGDALYSYGGFAEYALVPEHVLSLKPEGLSFEQACAVPQAAVVAEQGIRYKTLLGPGKKVLINGAGGGSGTFAVQMAKLSGAEVTGVDSKEKLKLISDLGADFVMDYRKEDFTKNGKRYDLILDLVASHCIFEYYRSLLPGGVYGMVGGEMRHIFSTLVIGSLLSIMGTKKIGLIGVRPNERLETIAELIGSGKIRPVIDRYYSLEEVPQAMHYLASGSAKGKVVIQVVR